MVGPDKGDGSLQNCQVLAIELGVADKVEFPGRVEKDDVPLWLNKGDIFLNTTNIDNTPISVMEAMACGLSIVSTNVGGVPFLLTDEINGLLVQSDNEQEMSDRVCALLRNPELCKRLSTNARHTVEKFDWGKILPQWIELIESCRK
jgi:glycosyltransferase involved in cell wall biosynthesis